jgi:chromosome segregation ATPase
MSTEEYASIACFHSAEASRCATMWAMKGELEALRAELSATKQDLETALSKISDAKESLSAYAKKLTKTDRTYLDMIVEDLT